MDNPFLVEVTRGHVVESRHRGSVAVVDAEGSTVLSLGDVERRVFPRSAVKAIQALPLLENGIADKYGLTDEEIALACASHSGEPEHAAAAASMLAKAGLGEPCLECGVHWPMSEAAARALAAQGGQPTQLHNNCSGKHAGFICLACGLGEDPKGYVSAHHPVQQAVRHALEDLTGASHTDDVSGTDGCSIPTYAIPLPALAFGFARFGTGIGLSEGCRGAAERIRRAVARHPFMVAGTGRFDTRLMEALRERAFVKVGAEGVYCAAFPELGYGVALKADDGGTRAAEAMMAALVLRFLKLDDGERAVVEELAQPVLKNWNGIEVGRIRVTRELLA
ncbi:asparaginase [Microvirga thermotolerans]|uniref:Asparaginase n=1 Tax=Microvirga thermotolerans TaxID=2651334 RepID=A0A5P9JTJ7_9HYPH|nr:asparaginase [Microvirga thermotolerans]QFU15957.1 asparaginase [Microvirga thermotolerans]